MACPSEELDLPTDQPHVLAQDTDFLVVIGSDLNGGEAGVRRHETHRLAFLRGGAWGSWGSCRPVPALQSDLSGHIDGRDLPEWMRDFDQLGLTLLGRRVCPPVNDPSWQIDDSVAPLPGEMVLNKTSSGPLNSTKLDQTLHNLGVNSLVVCGLTTAVCVTQTARETADRGFRVMVAEDACTEMSVEMHQAALLTFSYVFGRVRRTEEIVNLFTAAKASA
jgi:hypothetical protein